MNASDRKQVAELTTLLEELKGDVEAAGEALRGLADAEQEKFDNMPEGLQQGEAGQKIESAASALDEAASAAEDGNIGEALSALEAIE